VAAENQLRITDEHSIQADKNREGRGTKGKKDERNDMRKMRDKTQIRNKAKIRMTADQRTAAMAGFMWLMKDLDSRQEVVCPF